MKKYTVATKIKGETLWSDNCLRTFEVVAKTKKEAREIALTMINPYKTTIYNIIENKEIKEIKKETFGFTTYNKIVW